MSIVHDRTAVDTRNRRPFLKRQVPERQLATVDYQRRTDRHDHAIGNRMRRDLDRPFTNKQLVHNGIGNGKRPCTVFCDNHIFLKFRRQHAVGTARTELEFRGGRTGLYNPFGNKPFQLLGLAGKIKRCSRARYTDDSVCIRQAIYIPHLQHSTAIHVEFPGILPGKRSTADGKDIVAI